MSANMWQQHPTYKKLSEFLTLINGDISLFNHYSQAYTCKRRILIQVLPPSNVYSKSVMHVFIMPIHTCMSRQQKIWQN